MIIFLGAPGSGKGTQSRLLSQRDNYEIFALGDIFRREICADSEIGKRIEAKLQRGEFADLDIVMDLFHKYVKNSRVILDGFPRNLIQANEMENFVQTHPELDWAKNIVVIEFAVPLEVLEKRLLSRKICNTCDASLPNDSATCMFCSNCAKDSRVRSDDNQDSIANRLQMFLNERDQLKQFYSDKGIYFSIDATQPVEDVYAEVRSCMLAKNLV